MINKIKNIIKQFPSLYIYFKLLKYYYYTLMPTKYWIKRLWKKYVKYPLNLKNPKTYNEKIQWLKLYYKNPLIKICSNKLSVRNYVENILEKSVLNEIIGVYNCFDQIDFNLLPNKFVIKCTHDSGSTKIIKDKTTLNINELKWHFNYYMKIDYFHMSKEWGYKNLERKIIIEKLLEENNNQEIKDYKVFCFWGEPKLIQVDIDRHTNHKRNIYDTSWNYINLSILYPTDPSKIEPKPNLLNEMLTFSALLSKPFPHVRVDWYIVDNKLIFGEMTFYHGSGYEPFSDFNWEIKMGEWIDLTRIPSEHINGGGGN